METASSQNKTCCPPRSEARGKESSPSSCIERGDITFELCDIPGGSALMGTDHNFIPIDEESPARQHTIKPFRMMPTAVTNAMFKAFVDDTGYKTDAQRFGWSFVFVHQLDNDTQQAQATVGAEWWRRIEGAYWNCVDGTNTAMAVLKNHPVVHVSWNDAKAFADWAGGRLPSEAEWEHAARGGQGDVLFPWGNQEPDDHHFQPCNIWQGQFPDLNSCADGYVATAPAQSFNANAYGLYNMCGNVWEWTSGRFKLTGRSAASKQHAKHFKGTKTLKGGSYLCHKSYCFRYRIAARTGSTPDSTTSHQGFRLVFS